MGNIRQRCYRFAWRLDDPRRAGLCLCVGLAIFGIGWWQRLDWEIAFLCGWNTAVIVYLVLLGMIIFTADAAKTRERVSKVDPTQLPLLIVLVLAAILGIMGVGVILTAVGARSSFDTRLLVSLSVVAVILSWLLLHTAFGQHYARLYYDEGDGLGGIRRGFVFPGTPNPTYEDFLYVAFAIGLTYAMSDVNVTNEVQRRTVLIHSIISFFFYSTVLGAVLNAIVTS